MISVTLPCTYRRKVCASFYSPFVFSLSLVSCFPHYYYYCELTLVTEELPSSTQYTRDTPFLLSTDLTFHHFSYIRSLKSMASSLKSSPLLKSDNLLLHSFVVKSLGTLRSWIVSFLFLSLTTSLRFSSSLLLSSLLLSSPLLFFLYSS